MGGHCRQEHPTRSRLCLSQPQVLPWRKLPFGKGWNKARVRSSAGMLKSVEWSVCTPTLPPRSCLINTSLV